jgi:hypothetical protein
MKTGYDDVNPDRAIVLPLGRRSAMTAPCASTEDKSPHLPPASRSLAAHPADVVLVPVSTAAVLGV